MPENNSGHLDVNGIRMYYEIHGSGAPLVLVHGGGSSIHTTFGKVIADFAAHRMVIGVDLQAHGLSSDRNSASSFQQDADDLAELLRQLHISKADIFGFSNGGSTALQLAIRHPQVINKLVIASAIYRRDGMPAQFWDFMKSGTIDDMPVTLKQAYLALGNSEQQLQTMHDRDLRRMQGFTDFDAGAIRRIEAPTLVISTDQDVVMPEHSLEIFRMLPRGRLIILPGAHGVFIGEISTGNTDSVLPAITVKLIESFLDEPF